MRFSISPKSFNKLAGLAAVLLILPAAVACNEQATDSTSDSVSEMPAETETPTEAELAPTEDTLVDVAVASGSFDTLVAAIQAAGLADTLNSEGPFTVFAPTDEAFAALPEGVLDALLLPENQDVLAQILTYHVIAAEVPASEVTTGAVASVAGEDLDIVADANGVSVNGATVIQPDVAADNGIIHVIDTVLIPPSVDPSAL
ncbi:MAG: fasciclin domain-containing protein [Cyanobacteria bacterium P01_D01_bin.44]